jgi:hypothetical protein
VQHYQCIYTFRIYCFSHPRIVITTSPLPQTDLNTETSTSNHYEVFLLFRLQSHTKSSQADFLFFFFFYDEPSVAIFYGELRTDYLLVRVKVTLRLTVSQSFSLGVVPHLGLMIRYLILFDSYGLVFVGRTL